MLSSDPQWVSGNDARIHVRAARGQRDKLEILLNGKKVDVALQEVSDGLEGVITGLAPGRIKAAGETWSALPYDENLRITAGEPVEILQIKGATAYVHPVATLEP